MAQLSYIITTYNKLPFLKEVVSHLLKNKDAEDEIVITDGGSSDGTVDYLETLYREHKIHKYVSEKDKGEAHGFNKAILLSTGEIIKIITDDDAFYYPAIKACKAFMLAHPQVDVVAGNTGGMNLGDRSSAYFAETFQNDYISWKEKKMERFFFNGTCLMLRRSSLALLGLFNTSVLLTDLEFTLRVSGNANIAWCKGIISVRILNEQSNYSKFSERVAEEDRSIGQFYNYKHYHVRRAEQKKKRSTFAKGKAMISELLYSMTNKNKQPQITDAGLLQDFAETHAFCLHWLEAHPLNKEPGFFPL